MTTIRDEEVRAALSYIQALPDDFPDFVIEWPPGHPAHVEIPQSLRDQVDARNMATMRAALEAAAAARPRPQPRKPLYPVPFLPGDGTTVVLKVAYLAEFPRGADGTCAFCHGDPCGEGDPASVIGKFMRENDWADSCPVCKGRPT